jgi:hypothetical protein
MSPHALLWVRHVAAVVCMRLTGVTRVFDLPALKQPLKVRAGSRQCGDEIVGRRTGLGPVQSSDRQENHIASDRF